MLLFDALGEAAIATIALQMLERQQLDKLRDLQIQRLEFSLERVEPLMSEVERLAIQVPDFIEALRRVPLVVPDEGHAETLARAERVLAWVEEKSRAAAAREDDP